MASGPGGHSMGVSKLLTAEVWAAPIPSNWNGSGTTWPRKAQPQRNLDLVTDHRPGRGNRHAIRQLQHKFRKAVSLIRIPPFRGL